MEEVLGVSVLFTGTPMCHNLQSVCWRNLCLSPRDDHLTALLLPSEMSVELRWLVLHRALLLKVICKATPFGVLSPAFSPGITLLASRLGVIYLLLPPASLLRKNFEISSTFNLVSRRRLSTNLWEICHMSLM